MIRLIKYCKPEHSLLNGCTTVRLGTLEYYRELDPDFQPIADIAEGRDTVKVNSLKMETASPDAKEAVRGFFPDMPYIHIVDMNLHRTFPNSYIFCCSILKKCNRAEHAARFDRKYESHYEINNVDEFVRRLTQMLRSAIKIDQFSDAAREHLRENPIQEWGITVGYRYGPVRYVPEKVSEIEDGVMQSYIQEIPAPLRSVFVKPQKYQEDHEFRILFLMYHPRLSVLAVRKDPVDLPVLPVGEVPAELNLKQKPGAKNRTRKKPAHQKRTVGRGGDRV